MAVTFAEFFPGAHASSVFIEASSLDVFASAGVFRGHKAPGRMPDAARWKHALPFFRDSFALEIFWTIVHEASIRSKDDIPFMAGLACGMKNGSILRMRLIVLAFVLAAATLHAQEAEQRKRMIFPSANAGPQSAAAPAPVTPAGPETPGKPQDPAAVINSFFLALKSGQVDAAYEGLVKNTIISERKDNVKELMESTKKALDSYGPISGYEVVDSLAVGTSLVRQTCISWNQDLPLRWRFYFYRSEGGWKLVDMRVDDGLVELFEEAGRRKKD